MIYDRMCNGGGWNYGNSKVLDYALWPYPDITAMALIAMQDHANEKANQESLQVLSKIARETDSGLALCWAAICLNLYGQDNSDFQRQIEKRFAATCFSRRNQDSGTGDNRAEQQSQSISHLGSQDIMHAP